MVDLARIVGAGSVSTSDADRFAYSRDAWPRDLIRIRSGEVPCAPSCVVWPDTREEVAKVLELAARLGVPVVPFGAGSGVMGGARPKEGGIALDLKRLKAIRHLDDKNLRVEVEAGIIGERLERTLQQRGYTLGHFPSSIICSTLGGWLAARSAGQASTLYGKIEDMTFGLEVATPGRIHRSMLGPRPGRGADMNALVIGSEGCFAAITAAELRIRPLPEHRRMRGLRFPNVEAGVEAIRRMLRLGLRPAVVRLYDALDTFLGRGHGKDHDGEEAEVRSLEAIQKHAKGAYEGLAARFGLGKAKSGAKSGATTAGSKTGTQTSAAGKLAQTLVRGTVNAVLGSPLVLNRAIAALPEDCLLILGFEGQPALVGAEQSAALACCTSLGAEDLGEGPGEHWLANRYNVSFKQSKAYASGAFTDTMEVAATWDRLMPMYKAVRAAIGREAFVMAHFSHAYAEGCSIYFTFAGAAASADDPQAVLARYDRLWRGAMAAVHDSGGTLSHHHGVGELKADGMAREHGPGGMKLLEALKDGFDPAGVMNPGKLGLHPHRSGGGRATPAWVRSERGLPKEIRAAVGETNLIVSGSRTVVRPPDESGLASVLRVASSRAIPVVSDQTGFRGPAGAVQLDLKRLSGVSRLSTQSMFVEVEAGLEVDQLEALVARQGMTLGPLHPRAGSRTVGAALARGLMIRRGVAFGDLRDPCFAVRGLLASGAPIETRPVPRSATGPELDRGLIGGEGRWGIITRATLRLAVAPPHRAAIAFQLPSLAAAIEAARLILRRGIKPLAGRVLAGGIVALELVAHVEDHLKAALTVATSTAEALGGKTVDEGGQARGGRFDAVVEVASHWTRAEERIGKMREASGGEVWIDFLAPEGVTLVTRVVDVESRRRVAEVSRGYRVLAGVRGRDPSGELAEADDVGAVGVTVAPTDFETYDDVVERVSRAIDPSGVFRERRGASE